MTKEPNYQIEYKKIERHDLPTGALGIDLLSATNRAFVACMDGVYELDLKSKQSKKLYAHDSYASGIVIFPNEQLLISSGYDGMLKWFDLETNQPVRDVKAHRFWSWDLARAKNAPVIATSTGQYLAGDYTYKPKASEEPCVRVFDAFSGEELHAFEHLPPVQAVAVSDDGKHVGAGNLMGDAAVWNLDDGSHCQWNTPDFTAFGIIKSHCQVGGIYAAAFSPDNDLLVAGMGPMRDPMAGNGKQRWQRFRWKDFTSKSTSEDPIARSGDGECGEGLMETLTFHPSGRFFVMAGRLRGGNWNVGLFDTESSKLVASFKSDTRVTQALFSADGSELFLAGAHNQSKDQKKKFGAVDVYSVTIV